MLTAARARWSQAALLAVLLVAASTWLVWREAAVITDCEASKNKYRTMSRVVPKVAVETFSIRRDGIPEISESGGIAYRKWVAEPDPNNPNPGARSVPYVIYKMTSVFFDLAVPRGELARYTMLADFERADDNPRHSVDQARISNDGTARRSSVHVR